MPADEADCPVGAIIRHVALRTPKKTGSGLATRLAALASFGAATIHFAVTPTHWQEWMPAGVFFLSMAVFQLLWARTVLARPTNPVLAAGMLLNAGAIALWALSRTAGAPFGPHAGEAELVGAADLCALLLEIYVVMGAGWVWYRGTRADPISAFANATVLLGATSIVALASAVGVASGFRHGHHSPTGTGTDHHGGTAQHGYAHHTHAPQPATPSPVVLDPLNTPAAPAPTRSAIPSAEPVHDSHGNHEHDE